MRSRKASLAAVIVIVLCLGLIFTSCSRWRKGAKPAPAGESTVSAARLEGQKWYLVELDGKAVEMPKNASRPFIVLNASKKEASGLNGCNNFSGGYVLKGSLLVFRGMTSTKMACHGPEGLSFIEIGFMDMLQKTRTYGIAGNTLTFSDERQPLARFTVEEKGRK